MIRRIGLVASLLLALSACSGAIHKETRLRGNDPVAITVDARQRLILSQWDPYETSAAPGEVKPVFRRYCAEPSPDMFTVLGVAASGSGTLGLDSDAKTLNAALQAAFSSSETGTTIPRTQTINMLREMMFRTCERYLSGAISKAQFQTIAARDQRIMVSILAIEQLTGSITPPPVIINSSGNASTGFDPTELSETLTALHTKSVETEAKVTDKKKAYDTVNTTENLCPAATALTDEAIEAVTVADDKKAKKDKKAACTKASDELALAREEAKAADAIYRGGLSSAGRGQGVSSAATTAAYHVGADIARKEEVTQVAATVKDIVALTFAQDETLMFCLQALSGEQESELKPVANNCLNYMRVKVDSQRSALARKYNLSDEEVDYELDRGKDLEARAIRVSPKLKICAAQAGFPDKIKDALNGTPINFDQFIASVQSDPKKYFKRLGEASQDVIVAKLNDLCRLGEKT